jgi:hypothetical protein
MSGTKNKSYMLRIRQLPKPEYKLMKSLITEYNLQDETEIFAVALRLLNEVQQFDSGNGLTWILNVIDSFRTFTAEQREEEYEVGGD